MLRWLAGGSGNSSSAGGNGGGSSAGSDFIGKVLRVESHQVTVEEVIAEGGFSVVFRVKSSRGRRLALKRMAVNNDNDLYLARQEIAIMKALTDSPYSVTYLGSEVRQVSIDVHEVLILMELYEGTPVIDLLNQCLSAGRSLQEEKVMKIFLDVCQAVARLHHRTKPILHRDLKIENILCDSRTGNYVLCDYGSCTVRPMHPETLGASQCEEEIARFTTLAYRAPEMVSLFSGNTVTTKADIWALGCLLYKLCFFKTPFGEQALAIVSGQFTIPDSSTYSDQLHRLIRYMLEPKAESRPTIWQVCEAAFKLAGQRNPVQNVFNSVRPPAILPEAKRESDTKKTPKKQPASNYSTPSNSALTSSTSKPRHDVSITVTSISSRERPRARGAGAPPMVGGSGGPQSSPKTHTRVGSGPQQQYNTAAASSATVRSTPQQASGYVRWGQGSHLNPPSALYRNSRSLDSGLDEFGAVPFAVSPPSPQTRPPVHAAAQTQMQATQPSAVAASSFSGGYQATSPLTRHQRPDQQQLSQDLFGLTPFSQVPQASPVSAQSSQIAGQGSTASAPPPSGTHLLDEFGSTPFVACS